ncbi:MAG: fabD [Francisellaceae bacterium]|nr:fabD [Francisellaceae bacterium]
MSNSHNIAVVFPGQGSQSIGMLGPLAKQFSIVNHIFEEAADTLGYSLWGLIQEGPEDQLNQTEYTQPILLASAYAVWRVLTQEKDLKPRYLAGHSLGEYTALVVANSIRFDTGLKLVAQRGHLMQLAVPQGTGAMAAILGLEQDLIQVICAKASHASRTVSIANINSIGQIVIAGHKPAVLEAMELAKEQNAKRAILLSVSVPSHCALMKPAAEDFSQILAGISFNKPQFDIIHNVDLKTHNEENAIKKALVEQLYSPVPWVETIEFMATQGVNTIFECGPGQVLSGLNKRINKNLNCIALNEPQMILNTLMREFS